MISSPGKFSLHIEQSSASPSSNRKKLHSSPTKSASPIDVEPQREAVKRPFNDSASTNSPKRLKPYHSRSSSVSNDDNHSNVDSPKSPAKSFKRSLFVTEASSPKRAKLFIYPEESEEDIISLQSSDDSLNGSTVDYDVEQIQMVPSPTLSSAPIESSANGIFEFNISLWLHSKYFSRLQQIL